MSLATLTPTDRARVGFSLLPIVARGDKGGARHPFLWHDAYQRVSEWALTPALEAEVASRASAAADAIAGSALADTDDARRKLLAYIGSLDAAVASVQRETDRKSGTPDEEAFGPAAVARCREERRIALYNFAIVVFRQAVRDSLDPAGSSVQQLGQAAALFDAVRKQAPKGFEAASFELSEPGLRLLAALSLATAAEINVAYWQKDAVALGEAHLAKIAHRACHYFRVCSLICRHSTVNEGEMHNMIEVKRQYYEGLAYFVLSMESQTQKGESRRRKAKAFFDAALEALLLTLPNCRKAAEEELEVMVSQCVNFNRLSRKSMLPLAAFGATRRRCERNDAAHSDAAPHVPAVLRFLVHVDDAAADAAKSILRVDEANATAKTAKRAQDVGAPDTVKQDELAMAFIAAREAVADAEVTGPSIAAECAEEAEAKGTEIVTPATSAAAIAAAASTTNAETLEASAAAGSAGRRQRKVVAFRDDGSVDGPPVALEVRTNHLNLTAKNSSEPRDLRNAPYRYVQSLVTVKPRLGVEPGPSAVVFVLDLNGLDRPSAENLKELLNLALASTMFGDLDKTGIVLFERVGPRVEWVRNGNHFAELCKAATRAQAGDGTSVLEGVAAAAKDLATVSMPADIVVISDQSDLTAPSTAREVAAFLQMRAGNVVQACAERRIQVHAFVVGSVGSSSLLAQVCRDTSGDFCQWNREDNIHARGTLGGDGSVMSAYSQSVASPNFSQRSGGRSMSALSARSSRRRAPKKATAALDAKKVKTDGVSAFRYWLSALLTEIKQCVARDLRLSVKAAFEEVYVHDISPTACLVPPNSAAPLRRSAHTVTLSDVVKGSVSTVVVTFAIPIAEALGDTIPLGNVTLDFAGASDPSGQSAAMQLVSVVENVSAPSLVDREFYAWLSTLTITDVHGCVQVRYPDSTIVSATGGETLGTADQIVVNDSLSASAKAAGGSGEAGPVSSCVLRSVEGSVVDVAAGTKLEVSRFGANSFSLNMPEAGEMTIATATYGVAHIHVAGGLINLKVQPGTLGRVRLSKSMELTLCVFAGAINAAPKAGAATVVDSPRQAVARLPGPMSSPWTVTEDALEGWDLSAADLVDRFAVMQALDESRCRAHVAGLFALIQRVAVLKNRVGTRKQLAGIAQRVGRKIVLFDAVAKARLFLNSSLGVCLGGQVFASLKAQLDTAAQLADPLREHYLGWRAMALAADVQRATEQCRPRGLAEAFASPLQERNCMQLLSARERDARLRKSQMLAAQKEAQTVEMRRRIGLLEEVLQGGWDFWLRGGVTTADVTTVLFGLASRERPPVRRTLRRWGEVAGLRMAQLTLSVEAAAEALHFISEHMEPDEFNDFVEDARGAVEETLTNTDATRVHRAASSLFRAMDQSKVGGAQGWLSVEHIERHFRAALGVNQRTADRLEVIRRTVAELVTGRLQDDLRLLQEVEEEAEAVVDDDGNPAFTPEQIAERVEAREAALDSLELNAVTVRDEKVVLADFAVAMVAFARCTEEPDAQKEIYVLFRTACEGYTMPTVPAAKGRQADDAELTRLVDSGIARSLDGLLDKHLRKMAEPTTPKPEGGSDMCAPMTVLASLVPPDQAAHVDHWAIFCSAMRKSAPTVIKFMKSFPVLSVTPRHAARMKSLLGSKHLNHGQMQLASRGLPLLLDWVKTVMKAAAIVNRDRLQPPSSDENSMAQIMERQISLEKNVVDRRFITVQEPEQPDSGFGQRQSAAERWQPKLGLTGDLPEPEEDIAAMSAERRRARPAAIPAPPRTPPPVEGSGRSHSGTIDGMSHSPAHRAAPLAASASAEGESAVAPHAAPTPPPTPPAAGEGSGRSGGAAIRAGKGIQQAAA